MYLCLRWQVAREMFLKDRQLQEEKEAEERRQRLEAQRKEEERIRKAEEHRLATQKVPAPLHNCNLYTSHRQWPIRVLTPVELTHTTCPCALFSDLSGAADANPEEDGGDGRDRAGTHRQGTLPRLATSEHGHNPDLVGITYIRKTSGARL